MKLKIGDRIECPFCEAYAVKPPSKHVEDNPIWSLPNNSPLNEFDKLVRYVRAYRKHKKGTNWYDVEKAYQALSDETRKAIEHDPQN